MVRGDKLCPKKKPAHLKRFLIDQKKKTTTVKI